MKGGSPSPQWRVEAWQGDRGSSQSLPPPQRPRFPMDSTHRCLNPFALSLPPVALAPTLPHLSAISFPSLLLSSGLYMVQVLPHWLHTYVRNPIQAKTLIWGQVRQPLIARVDRGGGLGGHALHCSLKHHPGAVDPLPRPRVKSLASRVLFSSRSPTARRRERAGLQS